MFTEYVKIVSEDKEYIGRIVSIDSSWESTRNILGLWFDYPACYTIELLLKDKRCTFVKVNVSSLSEVQPYEVTE